MLEINVVTATDERYAKYLVVMLKSLFENNSKHLCNVYILCKEDELKRQQEELLYSLVGDRRRITLVKIKKDFFKDAYYEVGEWPETTLYRLALCDLLPKEIDKLLYLDVDIIVNNDLAELYKMDFRNNYMIACLHNGISVEQMYQMVKDKRKNPGNGEIFNAGMVLWNLKKIREDYTWNDFKQILNKLDSLYGDQSVLNYMFWDKTLYIDTKKYNNRGYDGIAIEDIVIIHLAGDKPWELCLSNNDIDKLKKCELLTDQLKWSLNEYYMKLVSIWWRYAKLTDLYEELLYEKNIRQEYFMHRMYYSYFEHIKQKAGRNQGLAMLMELVMQGISIESRFIKKGITQCALYGLGKVGKYIYQQLKESNIDIKYYCDKKQYEDIKLPYKTKETISEETIPIVVCVMYDAENIRRELQKTTKTEIVLLEEIIKV